MSYVFNTRKQLEDSKNKLSNINKFLTDYVFSNKLVHFKTFSDLNNTRKALIFPTKENEIKVKRILKNNNFRSTSTQFT